MKTAIITGGTMDMGFVLPYFNEQGFDYLIASDAGIHFFAQTGIFPNEILGDFDSADPAELEMLEKNPNTIIHRYPSQKDAADTELALRLALERGSTQIHLLCATGTRLDHMLGTIHMMSVALRAQVPCFLVDAHNRLQLLSGRTVFSKAGQYGSYVSFLPLTTEVTDVTLQGFRYPLSHATMDCFDSLGVSNEIVEAEATIDFQSGVMIAIESKD